MPYYRLRLVFLAFALLCLTVIFLVATIYKTDIDVVIPTIAAILTIVSYVLIYRISEENRNNRVKKL